jgi:hypothetical protein
MGESHSLFDHLRPSPSMMPALNFQKLTDYFVSFKRDKNSVSIYTRALICFALIRVLTLWSVSDTMFKGFNGPSPASGLTSVILFPSRLVAQDASIAFTAFAVVLIMFLFLKPNLLTNAVLFWMAVNLFVIKYPVTNGSDYLLVVMTLLNIPLSPTTFPNPYAEITTTALYNLSVLLSRVQVVFVYLISAWDKLTNDLWRSGEALTYISHLDTVANPWLGMLLTEGTTSRVIAWLTILFEASFVILVWKKRTRLLILCVGIVFHLMIWIFLSLPDFSLLMILCYLVFITDKDWEQLRGRIKRQPL